MASSWQAYFQNVAKLPPACLPTIEIEAAISQGSGGGGEDSNGGGGAISVSSDFFHAVLEAENTAQVPPVTFRDEFFADGVRVRKQTSMADPFDNSSSLATMMSAPTSSASSAVATASTSSASATAATVRSRIGGVSVLHEVVRKQKVFDPVDFSVINRAGNVRFRVHIKREQPVQISTAHAHNSVNAVYYRSQKRWTIPYRPDPTFQFCFSQIHTKPTDDPIFSIEVEIRDLVAALKTYSVDELSQRFLQATIHVAAYGPPETAWKFCSPDTQLIRLAFPIRLPFADPSVSPPPPTITTTTSPPSSTSSSNATSSNSAPASAKRKTTASSTATATAKQPPEKKTKTAPTPTTKPNTAKTTAATKEAVTTTVAVADSKGQGLEWGSEGDWKTHAAEGADLLRQIKVAVHNGVCPATTDIAKLEAIYKGITETRPANAITFKFFISLLTHPVPNKRLISLDT